MTDDPFDNLQLEDTSRQGEMLHAIEDTLAELLEAYAGLRERYIHGDIKDYHGLNPMDQALANEVSGIRQAATLVRGFRETTSGMGLPSWLYGEWSEVASATDRTLWALTAPQSSPPRADISPRSGAAHPDPVSRDGGTGSGCASNP